MRSQATRIGAKGRAKGQAVTAEQQAARLGARGEARRDRSPNRRYLGIGTSTHNFWYRMVLEAWFDNVQRAGTTRRYTEGRPVGLVQGQDYQRDPRWSLWQSSDDGRARTLTVPNRAISRRCRQLVESEP